MPMLTQPRIAFTIARAVIGYGTLDARFLSEEESPPAAVVAALRYEEDFGAKTLNHGHPPFAGQSRGRIAIR